MSSDRDGSSAKKTASHPRAAKVLDAFARPNWPLQKPKDEEPPLKSFKRPVKVAPPPPASRKNSSANEKKPSSSVTASPVLKGAGNEEIPADCPPKDSVMASNKSESNSTHPDTCLASTSSPADSPSEAKVEAQESAPVAVILPPPSMPIPPASHSPAPPSIRPSHAPPASQAPSPSPSKPSVSTRAAQPPSPDSVPLSSGNKSETSKLSPLSSKSQKAIVTNALLKVASSSPLMAEQPSPPQDLTRKNVPIHGRAVHALFLLELLRTFDKKEVTRMNSQGEAEKVKLGSLTTREIVELFVRPETMADGCSFIERLVNGGCSSSLSDWCSDGRFSEDIEVQGQSGQLAFGPVTFYVIHVWSYRFKDLVNLIQQHYRTLPGQQSGFFPCYYWLDVFALNQNNQDDTTNLRLNDIQAVISCSSSVLFTIHPLLKPVSPSRAWCLFELMIAARLVEAKGVTLEILVADDTSDKTAIDTPKSFADAYLELLRRFKAKAIDNLDISNTATSIEGDKAMILREIDTEFEVGGMDSSIAAFNEVAKQLLSSRMKEALLRHALKLGDATGAEVLIENGAELCSGSCFINGLKGGNAISLSLSKALSLNSSLRQLVIHRSNVQGSGAAALASSLLSHARIEELDMNDNPDIGEEGSLAIASLMKETVSIKILSLANTGLVDSSLAALAEALKKEGLPKGSTCPLKSLNLSGNKSVTSSGLESLFKSFSAPSCSLVHLTLSNIPSLGGGSSSALGTLGFSIGSCSSLNQLVLSNCKLTAADINSLAPGLVKSTGLSHLDLQENDIQGDQVGDALSRIVKGCKSLSVLLLDGNSSLMTKASASALSSALPGAPCLKKLGLGMTGMTTAGAKVLAPGISSMIASMGGSKSFCPLTDLDLSNNEVGDIGGSFIFSAIKAHRTLERINMNSTNLTKQSSSSILALIADGGGATAGVKGSKSSSGSSKGGVPLSSVSLSGNDESLDETIDKVQAWQEQQRKKTL